MENLPFYREGQEEEPLPLFHVNARTVGQPPSLFSQCGNGACVWTATARSFRLQKKPSPHTHDNPFLPTLSTFQLPPPLLTAAIAPSSPPIFICLGKRRGGENGREGGFSSREPSGRPTTSPSLCPPSSILSFFIVPSPLPPFPPSLVTSTVAVPLCQPQKEPVLFPPSFTRSKRGLLRFLSLPFRGLKTNSASPTPQGDFLGPLGSPSKRREKEKLPPLGNFTHCADGLANPNAFPFLSFRTQVSCSCRYREIWKTRGPFSWRTDGRTLPSSPVIQSLPAFLAQECLARDQKEDSDKGGEKDLPKKRPPLKKATVM